MPVITAIFAVVLSGYLFYIGWPIVAGIVIIFAIGVYLAAKPKRSLDFTDLTPSQIDEINQGKRR